MQQGYPVGRKQLKELRERVRDELLPRASTRRRRTNVWIYTTSGWLVVDASNASKAEEVLNCWANPWTISPSSAPKRSNHRQRP